MEAHARVGGRIPTRCKCAPCLSVAMDCRGLLCMGRQRSTLDVEQQAVRKWALPTEGFTIVLTFQLDCADGSGVDPACADGPSTAADAAVSSMAPADSQ